MKREKLKVFLQNYLDSVITPRIKENFGDYEFTVYDVLKGTYPPPRIHIFIDTVPNIDEGGLDMSKRPHKKIESDIEDFFRTLSIPNKIKIHWNKRPHFKKGYTPSEEI